MKLRMVVLAMTLSMSLTGCFFPRHGGYDRGYDRGNHGCDRDHGGDCRDDHDDRRDDRDDRGGDHGGGRYQ